MLRIVHGKATVGCSSSWKRLAGFMAAAGLVSWAAACGSSLSTDQVRGALQSVPAAITYRAEHYTGGGSVVAGTATRDGTSVKFEIVSGHPHIDDPLFPQGNIGLRAQRGVTDEYTVTFDLPQSPQDEKPHARLANDIEGAICELAKTCGGPAA